ncbi:MAG: cation:proton antiporter [Deltaproteobacteria bacterium]|nr:cation:proton antiporter [Deltaproteobacteria bacterium]
MYHGSHIIITAIILLSIASAGGILTRYFKIPYASMLVIIGLFVGIFHIFPSLKITPYLIYYVFLPVVIFEGAVGIKLRPLMSNVLPIGALSIFGTIISAIFTGVIFHFVLDFPLKQSLIFGAIITPTDPITILSMLKNGAMKHKNEKEDKKEIENREDIETLLAGESLFNDGISLVLFEVFLNLNLHKAANIFSDGMRFSLGSMHSSLYHLYYMFYYIFGIIQTSAVQFLYESIGGSILGIIIGYLVSLILSLATDFLTEIMISLLLAYASLIAAYYLHMSFIMAVIFSGITLANYGFKNKVTGRTLEVFPIVVEYITFIINSILFLIIGIEINLFKIFDIWLISLFIVSLVLFSRFLGVYIISPLVNLIKNRFKIFSNGLTLNKRYKRFLVFGGLKGALPIAMALSLPLNMHLRNEIITYVFIAVLFSLTIQAISFDILMKNGYKNSI